MTLKIIYIIIFTNEKSFIIRYFLAAYYQGPKFERMALQVEEAAEKLLRANGKQ